MLKMTILSQPTQLTLLNGLLSFFMMVLSFSPEALAINDVMIYGVGYWMISPSPHCYYTPSSLLCLMSATFRRVYPASNTMRN
jgi:hypothetical protein